MKQKGGNGIGVVVAAYNAAAWLVRCLDSVLAAADVDAADVCIVVADDGSTDGTAAIAALPAQVEKARVFDPFGHAGFDPFGQNKIDPLKVLGTTVRDSGYTLKR